MRVFKRQAFFPRHGKTEFWLPVSFFVYPRHRKREFEVFHFRFPFSYYIENEFQLLYSFFVFGFPTTLDKKILSFIFVRYWKQNLNFDFRFSFLRFCHFYGSLPEPEEC